MGQGDCTGQGLGRGGPVGAPGSVWLRARQWSWSRRPDACGSPGTARRGTVVQDERPLAIASCLIHAPHCALKHVPTGPVPLSPPAALAARWPQRCRCGGRARGTEGPVTLPARVRVQLSHLVPRGPWQAAPPLCLGSLTCETQNLTDGRHLDNVMINHS